MDEITAIPALIKLLKVKGALVSIDAMGWQTEIAQQIVEKEADYLLAVKGNQGHRHQALRDVFIDEHAAPLDGLAIEKIMNV